MGKIMMQVMLVGNPNTGKTTLFNALTGDTERVGNWPGVTVEKKTGEFIKDSVQVSVTDLPGIYSLSSSHTEMSQDEQIAAEAVAFGEVDVFLNVLDACHLERHLYLTSQLLELGKPVVLALNMSDLAKERGIEIDPHRLSTLLNCPVIAMSAHQKIGIDACREAILSAQSKPLPLFLNLPKPLEQALEQMEQELTPQYAERAFYLAHRKLEGASDKISVMDADLLMADARYQAIHQLVAQVQKKHTDASEDFTAKLDRIVLHRFWALPIFFSMMYAMFAFAIYIGGAFQDFFDITTDAIFVQGLSSMLKACHVPDFWNALASQGMGEGIHTTLTFIPVMASMYFFLALLETSGYMARAAFVVDKIMRILGLPGKSFVPMIVGFGCNVPAIMAARTLERAEDRQLTILMSPFMSCSARLAIYAVFVAAFFPKGGQNIVFLLYLIGILMAVLTGFLLRKTLLKGPSSPLILELPAYHRPSWHRLMKETFFRTRIFLKRAGKIIIPVCVVLGGLNAVHSAEGASYLSLLGQWLTPLLLPMGVQPENWPATVGLLSGMLAKEVVIGSLNTLYSEMGHLAQLPTDFHLWSTLVDAVQAIPDHLFGLGVDSNTDEVSRPIYGMMVQYFDGSIGAFAYLLFILLYIPCVSTIAAIKQEAGRRLMWFSIGWSLFVAYAAAVLCYQLGTMQLHPLQSLAWVMGMIAFGIGVVVILRVMAQGRQHVIANS